MARATCGVAEGYLLGARNADEVLVLSIRLDVILHALAQRTPRVVEHPQTAERVLDHIAHDPLGGEELRGGRDVRRRCFAFCLEELVFDVSVVVLIHPAQNGHALAPALVSENGVEFAHHAVGHHEAPGQQQLHGTAHAFKDARQAIGKLLALSHKQVAPQRFIQARHLELGYAIGIGRRYLHVQCVLHGLAAMAAVRTAQHAHTAGEPSACIHKANGHDAVEPGVGRSVAQRLVTHLCLYAQQLVTLLNLSRT